MSIARTTAEPTPAVNVRKPHARPESRGRALKRQVEFLSLEIEGDAGGDPYNRTGQHYLAELKNFER